MGVIDSASATASALAGLLEIHGLQAPADRIAAHVQLTTGDVEKFSAIADGCSTATSRDVEPVAVAGAA